MQPHGVVLGPAAVELALETDMSALVADTPVADELVEQFATRDLPLIDMQLRSVLGSLR